MRAEGRARWVEAAAGIAVPVVASSFRPVVSTGGAVGGRVREGGGGGRAAGAAAASPLLASASLFVM
jgi:hypothetical protein